MFKWIQNSIFLSFTEKCPADSSSSRRFTRSAPSPAEGPNVRKRSRGPASVSKLESGRSKRIKEDDNTSTNDSDNKDSSSEIDPNSDTDPEADVAKASPRKKYVIIFKLRVNYVLTGCPILETLSDFKKIFLI